MTTHIGFHGYKYPIKYQTLLILQHFTISATGTVTFNHASNISYSFGVRLPAPCCSGG